MKRYKLLYTEPNAFGDDFEYDKIFEGCKLSDILFQVSNFFQKYEFVSGGRELTFIDLIPVL